MIGLDNSLVGRAVVHCPGCGEERWYGYGKCRSCGTYLPGAREDCEHGVPLRHPWDCEPCNPLQSDDSAGVPNG